MNQDINSNTLCSLHDSSIAEWKTQGLSYSQSDFFQLVEENLSFNYQLWHEEDKARRDDMGFEFVYNAKRKIDSFNQQRNNRMEMMDEWLFHHLTPAPYNNCQVHSETPGMIIDRLSILALKIYHMRVQTQRGDVDTIHQKNCSDKLNTLIEQRSQLASCFDELVVDIINKKRTFRVYHQFKMYNDPNLNPELYSSNKVKS